MIGRLGIILFSGLLLALWALPAAAQGTSENGAVDTVVKTVCVSAPDYDSLKEIKGDLLLRAKREAANELFGELIVAATEVDNLVVTSDQIRVQSLGLLRLDGDARYSNGQNLGEMCVTLTAYVTPQDRARFEPETIGGRHCVTEALLVRELRARAKAGAIVDALVRYDPRLQEYETTAIMPLLRKVSYPESGVAADTDSYCASVIGVVVPIEVVSFLSLDRNRAAADTASAVRTPAAAPRPAAPTPTNTPIRLPTKIATATPMPDAGATATAQMAALAALRARTPTPTMTHTPMPDSTATAVASLLDVYATADAVGQTIADVAVNPVDGAAYLYVPAGDFTMGDSQGNSDEQPERRVQLDAFWITRTEVTNAQYARCVRAGVCTAPGNGYWQNAASADRPVTHVSWEQAAVYAAWVGGGLPTEAQWEKACRGADGRRYPWGEEEPGAHLLNFGGSGLGGAVSVGSYPRGASPYGALDMAGNVWEWTADWYDDAYYVRSPAENPPGSGNGEYRVVRGVSFHNDKDLVRCADRYRIDPSNMSDSVGFRVVSRSF